MTDQPPTAVSPHRRQILFGAAVAGALPLLAPTGAQAATESINRSDRRKLGTLDVSAVGIGVQNMSRTYQTTIPSRPEMHNIIRKAFDNGVTFYHAAVAQW
ncbi:hypothetical protein [Asticcacaulis machinosus]|uniref:Aldo/keto reductase n=1 Tax=Asticcacaulis machinosus TaxID=2984211 RepID=A0ABT5HMH2_9CAUL|nr:hypothetical protein [Asticcacaulis machinosus]MDC7677446.1 hypothetical protein [Asticcacaulis machinosus]